jgi:hypothetical protein
MGNQAYFGVRAVESASRSEQMFFHSSLTAQMKCSPRSSRCVDCRTSSCNVHHLVTVSSTPLSRNRRSLQPVLRTHTHTHPHHNTTHHLNSPRNNSPHSRSRPRSHVRSCRRFELDLGPQKEAHRLLFVVTIFTKPSTAHASGSSRSTGSRRQRRQQQRARATG